MLPLIKPQILQCNERRAAKLAKQAERFLATRDPRGEEAPWRMNPDVRRSKSIHFLSSDDLDGPYGPISLVVRQQIGRHRYGLFVGSSTPRGLSMLRSFYSIENGTSGSPAPIHELLGDSEDEEWAREPAITLFWKKKHPGQTVVGFHEGESCPSFIRWVPDDFHVWLYGLGEIRAAAGSYSAVVYLLDFLSQLHDLSDRFNDSKA